MASKKSKNSSKSASRAKLSMIEHVGAAQFVAPEDVSCGDFIAVMSVTVEWVPQFDVCDVSSLQGLPLRFEMLSCDLDPMLVIGVCAPLLLVQEAGGDLQSLDTRRIRLARLPKEFARPAWKMLRKQNRT